MTRRTSLTQRMIRTTLAALICAAAVIVIAGCGSSSKSSSKSAKAATTKAATTKAATTKATTPTATASTPATAGTATTAGTSTLGGTGTVPASSNTIAAYGEYVLQQDVAFTAAANKYENANKSGSLSALAPSSVTFGKAATAFADAFSAKRPPAKIATPIAALAAGLHSFAGFLDKLSSDAGHKDRAAVKADLAEANTFLKKIDTAEAQLSAVAK